MKAYPGGQLPEAPVPSGSPATDQDNPDLVPDAGCNPDFEDCTGKK